MLFQTYNILLSSLLHIQETIKDKPDQTKKPLQITRKFKTVHIDVPKTRQTLETSLTME